MSAVLSTTDFNTLVTEVTTALQGKAQGVGSLSIYSVLTDLVSLPALKVASDGSRSMGEVPIGLLTAAADLQASMASAAALNANSAAQQADTSRANIESYVKTLVSLIAGATDSISQANAVISVITGYITQITEKISQCDTATSTLDSHITLCDAAKDAANTAAASANAAATLATTQANRCKAFADNPIKIQNGTWWVWDESSAAYKDTGVSPANYVLTKSEVERVLSGDISSHSHAYLPLSGGAMGNTYLVTNMNADMLDGKHVNELGTAQASYNMTSSGWKRLAKFNSRNFNSVISISNTYHFIPARSFTLSVNGGYESGFDIVKISGLPTYFTKSRILYSVSNPDECYLEIYYNQDLINPFYFQFSNFSSECSVFPYENKVEDITGYTSYEVNLSSDKGMQADIFTGNLSGNATSATKLQTSRIIWGQSFNGAEDIAGTLFVNITDNALIRLYADSTWILGVNGPNNDIELGSSSSYHKVTLNNNSGNLVLDNSGNVGVGITTPLYKLHVNGTFYASGAAILASTLECAGLITAKLGLRVSNGTQAVDLTVGSDGLLYAGGKAVQVAA